MHRLQGLTCSRQHPFGSGHSARYPASYAETTSGGAGPWSPVSCRLSAAGLRFLSILFPPRNSALLTVGLPPSTRRTDLDGVSMFRTPETRLGSGVLCTPRATVSTRPGSVPGPPFAASQRAGPCSSRTTVPPRDVVMTRHQRGFTVVRPSSLPLACAPRTEQRPLSFSLSFAPRSYPQRTSGRGQVSDTDPDYGLDIVEPPSS
jgi:hypothetical protein